MIEDKLQSDARVGATTEPASGDARSVVAALLERASATADLTGATVKLAAAETRLAASSAGLFMAFLALLLVMVLITWMVALATGVSALMTLGLSPLASLSLALLVQLFLCGLLGYTLVRLGRQMSFPLTREAIRRSMNSGEPRLSATKEYQS